MYWHNTRTNKLKVMKCVMNTILLYIKLFDLFDIANLSKTFKYFVIIDNVQTQIKD